MLRVPIFDSEVIYDGISKWSCAITDSFLIGGFIWDGLYFGFRRRNACKKGHVDSAV